MQKKFVSTLLLLLFLNLLVKPAWIFGIDLTVQNRVGAGEYGLYFALFNFSLLFNILLDFGLTHYNNQAVAKDSRAVKTNFSHLTSLKVMLGFLYLLITILLGVVFAYSGPALVLLSILALNQFLASLVLFLRSNLSGLQYFKADSILSVIDKTLMIVICGALLFGGMDEGSFTVFHFAWAQAFSYFLTVCIAFLLVWSKVGIFKWRINFKNYRKGLRQSFPYALLILLMSLYTRVDGIMLDRMIGSYENGIYAAAFRLLDTVNQLGYLFAVLLLPMFSRMLAGKEEVSNLVRLSFNIIFVLLMGVVMTSFFNAELIMDKLYDFKDESLSNVFQLLILSSLAFGTTFIYGTLLTAAGHLRILNTIALSGFLVNILMNFILIPRYGAEGAAMATFSTQLLTAIFQLIYSFRLLHLKVPQNYIWRLTGFVLIAVFGPWFIAEYVYLPALLKAALVLALIFLSSVLFRLLNYKAAMQLVKTGFRHKE